MIIEQYRYVREGQRAIKSSTRQSKKTLQQHWVGYLPGLEIRIARSGGELTVKRQVVMLNQVRIDQWCSGQPEHGQRIQLRFNTTDQIGSHTLELNVQGKILSQEVYYPWGGTACWCVSHQNQTTGKIRRYAGKERDASGLVYYGYRYYAPWLRRWINVDPLGNVDGINIYCFVRNNPMTMRDNDGRMAVSDQEVYAANAYADFAYHRNTNKTAKHGIQAIGMEQKVINRMHQSGDHRFSRLSRQGQHNGIKACKSGMAAFIFHEAAKDDKPERYVVSIGGTSSGSYASKNLTARMWKNRSIWRRQMSANVANFFGNVPQTYKDADELVNALMKEIPVNMAVTITGHSLGAAAACYAAARNFSRGWPVKMVGFSPVQLGRGARQGALSGLDMQEQELLKQHMRLIYLDGDPVPVCCARQGGHLVPPMALPRLHGQSTLSLHVDFAARISTEFRS